MLQELDKFILETGIENQQDSRVIICGDFNSMPNSGVYQLISEKQLAKGHEEMLGYFPDLEFRHPFSLKSAYSLIGDPVSNWTKDFKGCLDYIWHSNHFEVKSILKYLNESELNRIVAFPNEDWPSDHFSLGK